VSLRQGDGTGWQTCLSLYSSEAAPLHSGASTRPVPCAREYAGAVAIVVVSPSAGASDASPIPDAHMDSLFCRDPGVPTGDNAAAADAARNSRFSIRMATDVKWRLLGAFAEMLHRCATPVSD